MKAVRLALAMCFLTVPGIAESRTYVGVGSCSSSNCHGSASPRKSSTVMQNEYVAWQAHDLHSKAYTNLVGADGRRIAAHLGIESPEKDKQCLDCHATNVGEKQRGEKFRIDDGVSCESCHGAGSEYLESHTLPGATHEGNLKAGLRDLVNPSVRAELCVSCHVGNEDKAVTHRLIGAGHPRLSFELDTFSMIGPKHWLVDDDYLKRKGPYQSSQAWLVGQLTNAEAYLALLASDKRSKDGIFPELSLQYCSACHHSLTEEQWKKREYHGIPGQPRLNTSSLVLSAVALNGLKRSEGARLGENANTLYKEYGNGVGAEIASAASPVLTSLRKEFTQKPLSSSDMKAIFGALARYGAEVPHLPYEVAEQIAMGLQSMASSISADGGFRKLEIEALYGTLKDPRAFTAEAFTAACAKLLKKA